MIIVASVFGMSLLHQCFNLQFEVFRVAMSKKSLRLEIKTDLVMTGLFLEFLLDYASFSQLHICMDYNLHELFNCDSFLTTSHFFDGQFEGYSDLFFKYACTF